MDPVSQGVLGASMAQAGPVRRVPLGTVALLGAWGGLAPDLDVLIQSPVDPLLFLEYHRQFTHALIFIPVGALFCALVAHWWVRARVTFVENYLFCGLGYATHALLDACTSYGTQLFWPFANTRVDWSNVSVVDPLFTLPMLVLVAIGLVRRRRAFAMVALGWGIGYLLLGVVQRERALEAAQELALSRDLQVERLEVKPAFASLLLWKSVSEAGGRYYVDAIRAGFDVRVLPGESVRRFERARDVPWLVTDSQQARDVERFRWFSQDFLGVRDDDPNYIIDVRYSLLPNEAQPLWGIRLNPQAEPDAHVVFETDRNADSQRMQRFWSMLLRGEDPG